MAELRKKLLKHDFSFVQQYKPYVLILEICINDLSICVPEVVGSKTDDLVRLFRDKYEVRVVGVCQVIIRNVAYSETKSLRFYGTSVDVEEFSKGLMYRVGIIHMSKL